MSDFKVTSAPTAWATVFIAGPIAAIEQACREYCFQFGLCVTVSPTRYVYTGGEETGAAVGLINYPRFPDCQESLLRKAEVLGERIARACCQQSFSVQTPETTVWYSRRPG